MFGMLISYCLFIGLLNFKPSEPYLSSFLVCDRISEEESCNDSNLENSCLTQDHCFWSESGCSVLTCINVSRSECGDENYYYCDFNNKLSVCEYSECYKHFSDNTVNTEIYPYSAYAYLPALFALGMIAELHSYRMAILLGVSARIATRFLLLFGSSLPSMQLMQVTYSVGTAAEDIFTAYVYCVIPVDLYQVYTSYIKVSSLVAIVLSNMLADILVSYAGTANHPFDLTTLFTISAIFVCLGVAFGLYILVEVPRDNAAPVESTGEPLLPSYSRDRVTPSDSSGADGGRDDAAYSECIPVEMLLRKDQECSQMQQQRQHLIVTQMHQLINILQQDSLLTVLLMWWIFGGAVYNTLYNYEVAIYEELKGDSVWNGSVLSVMLVAGAACAMVPVWAGWDRHMQQSSKVVKGAGGGQDKVEDIVVTNHDSYAGHKVANDHMTFITTVMLAIGILSSISLVLFIKCWPKPMGENTSSRRWIDSICFLTIFIATWQLVTVVVYTALASALKTGHVGGDGSDGEDQDKYGRYRHISESQHGRQPSSSGSESNVDPPYSVSIVLLISMNVLCQIAYQFVLFSFYQLEIQIAARQLVCIFVSTFVVYAISAMAIMYLRMNALYNQASTGNIT